MAAMTPSPLPPPGWYPDPGGMGQRYWDGSQWAAALPVPLPAAGVIERGPNHALHFVLTLFTFWACGGWGWVWLVVALNNKRTIRTVDAYGRIMP